MDVKSPPRRSLDGRYRYIKPGGDAAGTEGKDVLVGEDALVRYACGMLNRQSIASGTYGVTWSITAVCAVLFECGADLRMDVCMFVCIGEGATQLGVKDLVSLSIGTLWIWSWWAWRGWQYEWDDR